MLRTLVYSSCFIFSAASYAGTMGSLPVSNFSGFYVGGSLGGNFSTASEVATNSSSINFPAFFLGGVNLTNNSASNLETKIKNDSGIGALYLGYGLSWTKVYLGAEIFGNLSQYKMKNAMSITHATNIINSPGPGVVLNPTIINTNSWTTTAKLSPVQWGVDIRPGFIATTNLLMYGRVGVAMAKLSLDTDFVNNSPYQLIPTGFPIAPEFNQASSSISLSNSKNVYALRLGGGLEYSVSPNWSIRMDYTNVQYGKIRTSGSSVQILPSDPIQPPAPAPFFGPGVINANHSIRVKNVVSNAIMVGLSYYFS